MRDETLVVSGRLTGRWRIQCGVCGTQHMQRRAIARCAERFAHVTLGNDVRLSLPRSARPTKYEALKKGLSDELERTDPETLDEFEMPVEVYARAETREEAAALVLEEFGKYVATTLAQYKAALASDEELCRKILASPNRKLGTASLKKQKWGHNTTLIDGVEMETNDVLAYFLSKTPDCDAKEKIRKNSYAYDFVYLDPDEDIAVLKSSAGDGPFVGFRPINGVMTVKVGMSREDAKKESQP
jgi:hypothetical protein